MTSFERETSVCIYSDKRESSTSNRLFLFFIGIAVDWVAKNLYWTDMRLDTIEAAHIDGSNRSVILSLGLDAPRALALDPRDGFVHF